MRVLQTATLLLATSAMQRIGKQTKTMSGLKPESLDIVLLIITIRDADDDGVFVRADSEDFKSST